METAKILTANLLDIVFDGRNKSYGAYELRKTYPQRLAKALWITAGICLVIAGAAWLKNAFAKDANNLVVKISPDVVISDIKPVEEKLPEPLPPPPAPKVEVPKVKTIAFTTPVITKEDNIEPPPAQDELIDTRISNMTQDGVKDIGIVAPLPSETDGRGLVAANVAPKEENTPFAKVEVDAAYIGNWRSFLERNLSGDVPIDNGAAPGTYTVVIQFVVDINGAISDIKPVTNLGFGMEQEAVRVIKKSGKWKPAIQNGREVKAYRKQPIIFQIREQ